MSINSFACASLAVLVGLVAVSSQSALAQSVPFTGTIGQSGSCTIVVQRNGTMVVNPAHDQMSSKFIGGESAIAEVAPFNGIYSVSATPYRVWNSAPESHAAPNTTWQASHSGTYRGNYLYGERTTPIGLRARNNRIAYLMEVHLVVNKTGGNTFPNGNYSADVGILCE